MTFKELKEITKSIKITYDNLDDLLEVIDSIPMTGVQRYAVNIFIEAAIDSRIVGDLTENQIFLKGEVRPDERKAIAGFLDDPENAKRFLLFSYDGTIEYSFCKGYKLDAEKNKGEKEDDDELDREENPSAHFSLESKIHLFKRLDAATVGQEVFE